MHASSADVWGCPCQDPDLSSCLVVVVLVVVDLYSASCSASNALIVPFRRKKMSFQRRSEVVGTPSRVPEWVWKRVPFLRTRDVESPTTKRAGRVPKKRASHIEGPCGPSVLSRHRGTTKKPWVADRRCCRAETLVCRVLETTRAAAFCTRCNLSVTTFGTLANSVLQSAQIPLGSSRLDPFDVSSASNRACTNMADDGTSYSARLYKFSRLCSGRTRTEKEQK